MVKNKGLPDSARLCCTRLVTLSLSPSQTWPHQGWSHVSSLTDAIHPKQDPPGAGPWPLMYMMLAVGFS